MNDVKNFVMISPNFPKTYYKFAESLKNRNINVLGIGDAYNHELDENLTNNLIEYVHCNSLENLHDTINAVGYLKNKYGSIDFLESNNEYWLENDSTLREWFSISSGIYHRDILKYKAKSEMKKYFGLAGVKYARYALSDNYEEVIKLIEEVGYPIFVKPNIGVGASGTRRIKNIEDLQRFYSEKDNNQYIFEQFIDGEIYSFDGITNSKGEIIFKCAHKFLEVNDEIVSEEKDDAYFTYKQIPTRLDQIGEAIVKSFNLKSRCFHIEFFKLKRNHQNLGRRGEYIALEVNMRPAGGYTPDLISYAMNVSFYDVYADMIKYDENRQDMKKEKFYAMSVSRRDNTRYKNDIGDIFKRYKNNIVLHGRYPEAIRDVMGDFFIFARFSTLKEANEFQKIVREK